MTSELSVVLAALGLSAAFFLACWIWGMAHDGDASVTDAYYGFSSLAQGALTFALWHRHTARGAIVVVLAGVWSVGLAQMLFRRWRKNHASGGDERYQMAVEKFKPGANLWWMTLLSLVVAQTIFVTVLNLPLEMAIMSKVQGISTLDVVGFALIALGGAIEVIANRHLEVFKRDPANKGKTLMTGLWAWSRHPNYFGNTLVYFGFFVVAIREPRLWWTVAGPIAIFGLLRYGSGVRLTEWMMLQKRKDDPVYTDYLQRTSPFFLFPPRRSKLKDAGQGTTVDQRESDSVI
jgi:steroid 5-alpha reductase family enzyme